MYQPRIGRFLQADPLGYRDQVNLYTYAGNSPASKTDALGLFGLPIKKANYSIKGKFCFSIPAALPILWVCVSAQLQASQFECCDALGEMRTGAQVEGSVSVSLEIKVGRPGMSLSVASPMDLGHIGDCPPEGLSGDVRITGGIGYSVQYQGTEVGGGCYVSINLITGEDKAECRVGYGSFMLGIQLTGSVKYVEIH